MKKSWILKLFCTGLMLLCLSAPTAVRAEESTDTSADPVSLSGAEITLSYTSCTYNGSARTPGVTVTVTTDDSGTATLKKNTDYTVAYSNNTDAGTATVTVTGDGTNYTGTASASFTINPKSLTASSAGTAVTLSASSYTYNGKTRTPSVKSVKLTLNGSTVKLTEGTDFTITNKGRKNVGTGTVKITGTGNYKGTVKATFKIKPKKPTEITYTAASKGIAAEWTAVSAQASGYQIQCASNKSFTKSKKTVTVTGRSTEVGGICDLTGKKTYYVRMRTYKTVDGVKYYSAWTAVKKVTTLKKVTVFAGDSIMTGMQKSSYNGISYVDISGTEKVIAKKSLNPYTYQTTIYSGEDTYLDKALSYKPYRLYIMLGTNGIEYLSVSYLIETYEELIECIQEESPTTDIVILAVPPVSQSVAASRTGFKNISKLNKNLKALAKSYGLNYYDYTGTFENSSGYLKSAYNGGDGIHWNLKGYKKFAALITKYDAKLEDA